MLSQQERQNDYRTLRKHHVFAHFSEDSLLQL